MRASRRVSESGYYHVILRGNGRQRIFEDDADRRAFLEILARQVVARGVDVIAWCLMDNHVHLVLCDGEGRLSEAVGALAMRYAQRFNVRSGHIGHVFQERFKSVPIESEPYLLEAVRYVHNNPQKAGICESCDYPWSSFGEYVGSPSLTNTGVILDLLGERDGFEEFCRSTSSVFYRFDEGGRVPDDEMSDVAAHVLGDVSPHELKMLPRGERNELLAALRTARLSVRQIERLTGIGAKTITRATT